MDISKISHSEGSVSRINVIIEIPSGLAPAKYEVDEASGAIRVDRFVPSAMYYPCNYGFIPHTLAGDGDPVDVLVVTSAPVIPGAVILCRPVGVLIMEDEGGQDEKILAVPCSSVDPFYSNINSYEDLPEIFINKISHFFEHYKDLDNHKWTKIVGWGSMEKAEEIIKESLTRAETSVS